MNNSWLEIKVWGDYACFTRPDMKVERVSYPVITPSAARGILEAILWKPEMRWEVREIHVLKDIRFASILRNEVNNKAVVSTAKGWAEQGGHFFAEEDRAQRHTLALKDVAYLIKAEICLQPNAKDPVIKYREMFNRRVNKGQSFQTPCFGCREFPAFFSPVSDTDQPADINTDLGRILFDLKYAPDQSGRGIPKFFMGRIEGGVFKVPEQLYKELNT